MATELVTALAGFDPDSAPDLEAADQSVDRLLDAVGAIPHRPIEAAAAEGKELAKSFQRSARQRSVALEKELRDLKGRLSDVAGELESARQDFDNKVAEKASAFEAKADELAEQLSSRKQVHDTLLDEQTAAFTTAQGERTEAFDAWKAEQTKALSEQHEEAKASIEELLSEGKNQSDALVDDLRNKDQEAEQLVGSISIRGTADRYEKEAENQARIADRWRRVTVFLGIVAGIAAGSAAFLTDQTAAHIAGKLALGVLLAGVAGYTARQSAQHRKREEAARKLHLDLAAFGPFIDPLPEDMKNEERVHLGRRVFAREEPNEDATEHGTSARGLLPRRQAEQEGG
ncbi:MAG TPA: hypothetical protein VFP23_08160 [Solirubrobacterales bacterium]|nr:hypothetical protein [Solirubrobacterales bacterium]